MKNFLFAFALLPLFAHGQYINTVAGNGTNGYTGNGGMATAAEVSSPAGIAVDVAGNKYIADYGNHTVRKISPSGIITAFAGNGTAGYTGDGGMATNAQLYNPVKLYLDTSGNLFISDFGNNVIRKVATSGIITTVAGNGISGFNGDNIQATAASLYHPSHVAIDHSGNMFIADYSNARIRKVSPNGIITTIAGNGNFSYSGDNGPAVNAEINDGFGLALDTAGNLYFADATNNRIRKISTSGIITTVAGNGTSGFSGDNGQATAAKLSNPAGIAIDTMGNMYIADDYNNRIRKVTAAGIITTIAGNGTLGYNGDGILATTAELNNPNEVIITPTGQVYFTDDANNRVRTLSPIALGLSNLSISNYKISPNPFNSQIVIESTTEFKKVEIFDVLGQCVAVNQSVADKIVINVEKLTPGIYFIKVDNQFVMRAIKD